MVSECYERHIERPCGISGYRPSAWCAVCGRTESLQAVKGCIGEKCTNVCHVGCLGEAEVFECGNTGRLRALAGINDPVTPYIPKAQATPDPPSLENPATQTSTDSVEENTDDGLNDLRKEELVKLVRRLRSDLAGVKSQLRNYRSVSEDLVHKRRILVEALSVVDTLLAIRSSEGVLQCTVACSAKAHKIDGVAETVIAGESVPSSPPDSPQPPSLPPSTPDNTPTPHTSPSPPLPSTPFTSHPPSSPPSPPPPPLPSTTTPPSPHPPSPPLPLSTPVVPAPPTSSSTQLTRAPLPVPPHHSHSSSTLPPPQLASTQVQGAPLPCEDSNPFSSGAEGQSPSRGGSNLQRKKKKKKPASRRNTDAAGAPAARQQPRQETSTLRQQQTWCSQCRRQGHSRDQCPKEVCDYCQGRNHSSLSCYIRIADQRQKELVQAVRQSGQETLLALRSVAWQLHQPPQPQQAVPSFPAPHSTSAPAQWPHPTPVYPGYYGARSHQ